MNFWPIKREAAAAALHWTDKRRRVVGGADAGLNNSCRSGADPSNLAGYARCRARSPGENVFVIGVSACEGSSRFAAGAMLQLVWTPVGQPGAVGLA